MLIYSYEQRMNVDWSQRGIELIGLYHPSEDWNFYFFGGVDLVSIKSTVTLSEGVEYEDRDELWVTEFVSDGVSSEITAVGLILGAGVEIPSGNGNTATVVSLQFSSATTDDAFFGTDDFKVNVGGYSGLVAFKWYLPTW